MDKNKNTQQGAPLVSIRCLVYNHEPYLRQCLDGFVMQQTTFIFEAIVHDDASTDGSAAIIREYAEKYPDIIKPIFEAENQYSKHGPIIKIMDDAMHPDSKYIAICEGDDYWTDPHKLQIQVDFLESHPDYSFSVHDFRALNDKNKKISSSSWIDFLEKDEEYRTLTLDDYKKGLYFTQTLTCVYRKTALANSKYSDYSVKFDMTMFYALLTQGKCVLFNRVMGVYRRHQGSATFGKNSHSFHDWVDNRLLKLCEIEGTPDVREFVYNYLKPLALVEILFHRWDVILGYFKYLGFKRGVSLAIVTPLSMVFKSIFRKTVAFFKHVLE